MIRPLVFATLLALAAGGRAQGEDRPLADLLAEGWTKQRSGALDEARVLFEDALVRARDEQQAVLESETLRGIAATMTKQGDYVAAQARLDEALSVAEASGSRAEIGWVLNGLGSVAWYRRRWEEARAFYERAVVELEAAGDDAGAANTLANLTMLVPGEEKDGLLDRGLRLAAKSNDPYVVGRLLQHEGDWRRANGDFAGARVAAAGEASLRGERSRRAAGDGLQQPGLPPSHAWLAGDDKAAALRTAQTRMLRALRGGRVTVDTAAGPVVLPEHPALWAPFVLLGEP